MVITFQGWSGKNISPITGRCSGIILLKIFQKNLTVEIYVKIQPIDSETLLYGLLSQCILSKMEQHFSLSIPGKPSCNAVLYSTEQEIPLKEEN